MHTVRLRNLANQLRDEARTLRSNADEQERVSKAGVGGAVAGGAHVVSTTGWDRTVKSGVGGRNVDESDVELVQMSDGTWRVHARESSSWELSFTDWRNVLGLAAPQLAALNAALGRLGGSTSMFGVSDYQEYSFKNKEDAERFMETLKREANEVKGLDGLHRYEVEEAYRDELKRGTQIEMTAREHSGGEAEFKGSFDFGGELEASEEHVSSAFGLEKQGDATVVTDTVRGLGFGTIKGSMPVLSAEAAFGKEISIIRNTAGEVIAVKVVQTTSPMASADLSSSDIVSAIVGKGAKEAPYAKNLSGFLSSNNGVSTGTVFTTETTYDLTAPENRGLAASFGCTDPHQALATNDVQSMVQRVEGQASGSRTLEVSRVTESSEGARVISYESQSHSTSSEVLYRETSKVP